MDLVGRVEAICRRGLGERDLRIALLAEIGQVVPSDAHAWVSTDPETSVGWSPVAEVPVLADLTAVIRAKYLTTVNRWTALPTGRCTTLLDATDGDPARSLLWRDWLSSYGIADVASIVFHDRFGCWGFLDLWRRAERFERSESASLETLIDVVTPALRHALLATFAETCAPRGSGPVVSLLGDDLRPIAETTAARSHMEALLPAEPGRALVPAAALNVAAQLCSIEAGIDDSPSEARAFVPGRSWMTVRAGRIEAGAAVGATIAVTFDAAGPTERADLYARVAGLSDREAELLGAVIAGNDTRHVAQLLHISEHTVQDHLKSIFAKTKTDSRRQLIARAAGTGS